MALLPDDIHLVTFLDKRVIGRQGGDGFRLFDVRSGDELALFEFPSVLEQLILQAVIDVFLDDDVFFVPLWHPEELITDSVHERTIRRR